MTRRWTESEEEKKKRELLKLYVKQNKSIREVGKILGIAESTVYDRLVRLGISSLRARKPRYNNIRDDLLIPDRNKSIREVGKILGIAESTVYDRLVRLGISSLRARKPRYNNIRDDLLIPKYSEDLAEFTGILLGDGHLNHTQVTVTPLSNQ